MKRQVHVYYSGRVQGVGFRFTAEDIASDLGICGWVRNLGDGRVEITAEGEKITLKKFLERMKESFLSYIRDVDVSWSSATGEFNDFSIRFW